MNANLIILLVLVSTLLSATFCSERFKRRVGEWGLKKISCSGNAKYVKNEICTLKSVNRKETAMSFGATLLSEQTDIKMQVQHWQKMNSNRYMPGMFNIKGDLCDMTAAFRNDKSNVLKTVLIRFDATFAERYKSIIHPCPYSGQIYVYNSTFKRSFKQPLMTFLPTADYKVDFRILTKNGEEMCLLTLFASDK